MILAAIASSGAVLFTMYDPGDDKCMFCVLILFLWLVLYINQGPTGV